MRISDWSSDVCSSDLFVRCTVGEPQLFFCMPSSFCGSPEPDPDRKCECKNDQAGVVPQARDLGVAHGADIAEPVSECVAFRPQAAVVQGVALRARDILPLHQRRSEEHTSELQSLMRISYAVFCLKKKNNIKEKIKQLN